MKLIIKKENDTYWLSFKRVVYTRFKITSKIIKLYYKIKGYEVEELDE